MAKKIKKTPTVITYPGSWADIHKEFLEQLGATVIEIHSFEEATARYKEATHVLLQGGADVDPKWYKQVRTHSYGADERRDKAEYALAYSALKHKRPLFGVCRGHQMIAVVAGAKLIQDLGAIKGQAYRLHSGQSHWVQTHQGSKIREFYDRTAKVNSFHHQAVSREPKGFRVTAVSLDGIIEAMESENVLTVQWHPEAMQDTQAWALYETFLTMRSPK